MRPNMRARVGPSILMLCVTLAGCTPQATQTAVNAVSQAEAFNFQFRRLQPDANQQYMLRMDLGRGCRDYPFDKFGLQQVLQNKQFPVTIAGVTSQAEFRFEALESCGGIQELRMDHNQLQEFIRDASGNVTGRRRPQSGIGTSLIEADLSSAGVVSVLVNFFQFAGQTVSRTTAPGPMTLTAIELPGNLINATGLYAMANTNAPYAEATLKDVLPNPPRISVTFSFLATLGPNDPEILLAWDGEILMRTDL